MSHLMSGQYLPLPPKGCPYVVYPDVWVIDSENGWQGKYIAISSNSSNVRVSVYDSRSNLPERYKTKDIKEATI